jgi:phospholipase/lecithinase/hemolysin
LVEQIYQAGGRKFVFMNVPPISLSPVYQAEGETVVQDMANYLTVFNQAIANMVTNFEQTYTDVS